MSNKIILLFGPVLCLLLMFGPIDILGPKADPVLGIAIWMLIWWITEAVSISVTALIPLTFYPLAGIMDIKEVASFYGHPIVFLFFGGFIMALALEKVNLHRRIALNIIKITGSEPDRVILGFLISTAFLSMWISNTATTVVMLPIAYSVIQLLTKNDMDAAIKSNNFALSIMLGIAYAANVGGIATIIGTPPNIVLAGFLESEYGYSISFIKWMGIGLPFAILMLGLIYVLLTKILYPNTSINNLDSSSLISDEIEKLGPINKAEKKIMVVFILAITFWIFKGQVNTLLQDFNITDTTISMLAAFSCFCIVNNNEFIFKWEDTKNLPWGIIILFGGGLSLANGLSQAGLVDMIGSAVSQNLSISILAVSLILIAVMLFMTELMSNVALVAIMSPMVAGVAIGLDADILHLLIPIAMASSCAFMLPMATPPNAIVFASGHIKVSEMARTGIVLNLASIGLLILFFKFLIPYIMPSI